MNMIKIVIFSLFVMKCASNSGVVPPFFHSQEVSWTENDKVYILFRHAEKEGGHDPHLAEAGMQRAATLQNVFSKHKPSKILSTDTNRTRQTVELVSGQWDMPVEIYDPKLVDESVSFLKSQKPGIYLISGHSNTTPTFANALCKCSEFAGIDESDYTNIYIVVINAEGVTTHQLHY